MGRIWAWKGKWSARCAALAMSAAAIVAAAYPAAAADPMWAPANIASVHPGVQTYTNGAQCTSNFVFTDGVSVYLGQAAHCSGTGGSTQTNGCTSPSLPLGTPVQVQGATKPGTLVYNSWLAMQSTSEKDANTCAFNDLALVRLDPADAGKVNPTVPFWGGPAALNTAGITQGSTVVSYGNSKLRGGISVLSPKQGLDIQNTGGGWTHQVVTLTPGVPGDSGSAFLDSNGSALGILSTLELAPAPATNGVSDLSKELAYMHTHSLLGRVKLAPGNEPFRGALL